MDASRYVGRTHIMDGLSEDEKKGLSAYFKDISFSAGDYVFREKDDGDSLYVVESGLVIIKRWITEGNIEKMLLTAEPGMVFGEMSFMDKGGRAASAFVEQDAELKILSRADFDKFIEKDKKAGSKVLDNLLHTVVGRLRGTTNAYFDAVQYNLQVSGSQQMNFHHLISSGMGVKLDLITGKSVSGAILQVEKSDAGFQVIIRKEDRDLVMIPYHAVSAIVLSVFKSI